MLLGFCERAELNELNDLPGETVGGMRAALYADDSKLHKNVSSVSDCLSLQTTLANVNDWS